MNVSILTFRDWVSLVIRKCDILFACCRWLQQVNDYGISLVRGVPTEDGMVHKVCRNP